MNMANLKAVIPVAGLGTAYAAGHKGNSKGDAADR